MKEPMGTLENPARSCHDLRLCHSDKPDGKFFYNALHETGYK
jgi:hypothetical protein